MASLPNSVLDGGLDYLTTNGSRIDITNAEATTYSQATTIDTFSLGNKTGVTVGAAADATSGRKVATSAITDGTVTGTGTDTATHWALTDGVSELLATGILTASQAVTNGNTFTLDAIEINFLDPTSV